MIVSDAIYCMKIRGDINILCNEGEDIQWGWILERM